MTSMRAHFFFCLNIGGIVKETEALTVFHLQFMIAIVHRLKEI